MPEWIDNLRKGPQDMPPRICVYGGHGVGKSTFASEFPSPVFISTEDGLDQLDVVSFQKAEHVNDVVEAIKTLLKEDHEFKTVVVDSVDWLANLIVSHVNEQHDEKAQAYGKGQAFAAEEFREILQGLDMLRKRKGMNVVLVAHSSVTRHEDPRAEPYDRYQPKLPRACNALLMEWVDVLAFAAFDLLVRKVDVGFNNTKNRGVSTGDRMLYLVENAAYNAKNRYKCPEEIEMTFANFAKHVPVANL